MRKKLYVVCDKKSRNIIKKGWTATVYTSKKDAYYMGVNSDQVLIEYTPEHKNKRG